MRKVLRGQLFVWSMGSDWMNLTVEPSEKIPKKFLASSSPPTPEEIVRRSLKERGDLISNRTPTIQLGQPNNLDNYIREIAEDVPCRRILAIRLSDSTHAGGGVLYRADEGAVQRVDEWVGYEEAKGADVVGYFREEHRIKGSYEDPW